MTVYVGEVQANTVWDTGAGITIADQTFIERHPALFQPIGQSTGKDSTGASVETPMFIMAAVTIAAHQFPPHKVAGVDLSRINATIEISMDLILGYNTLSKANWVMDFPGRRWAISKLLV